MTESRLRVCYVVGYFYPLQSGAERQALEQGTELVRQGHEVHVVTRAVRGLPRDETVRGIQVHRWVQVIERGPLFAFSFVWGVVRALQKLRKRVDVVHTHQALWEAVATGASRRVLRRIPTIVQPASSGYFGEAEELLRTKGNRLLRRLILANRCFAAISNDIEREWLSLGVPPARVHRTTSGVDTSRFHPDGGSAWRDRIPCGPRVVFTGRLHPQKNLDLLIDAWPGVRAAVPATLVLAGEGAERARLESRLQSQGLGDTVILPGAVDDVADLLRAADVFVLPSVAEGMSNSLLEAMASGCPIVASDIGGNRDLIQDGGNGVLVAPDSAARWSQAIVRMLNDREFARRMGSAAAATIAERYALPVVVARYVGLYRRLLSRTEES